MLRIPFCQDLETLIQTVKDLSHYRKKMSNRNPSCEPA
ncbi:hypothetical protein Acaty_c2031 [Acidithiobacillus caldus ATCC 51756]|uniref:Uncharacterized protein n=1 Tax=Acidithiobacillus caldus (strain ATCC 51756 / DSM 8584 / KU) TaxID=637389 RepID=A0A060A167_ACICK|nr:hypothetical protein Acaty_c2031 [Acidithiobacillus caldus ATCC 51756]